MAKLPFDSVAIASIVADLALEAASLDRELHAAKAYEEVWNQVLVAKQLVESSSSWAALQNTALAQERLTAMGANLAVGAPPQIFDCSTIAKEALATKDHFNASATLMKAEEVLLAAYGIDQAWSTAGQIAEGLQKGTAWRLYSKDFESFMLRDLSESFAKYSFSPSEAEFVKAAEAISVPWIDVNALQESTHGFAGLMSIGKALQSQPYEEQVVEFLRHELGDWRAMPVLADGISLDPDLRRSLYVERGFDPSLSSFPVNTLDVVLHAAGLELPGVHVARPGHPLPVPIEPYRDSDTASELPNADDSDAVHACEAPAIILEAHRVLYDLETSLRSFIDQEMTRVFGADWTKEQVPSDVLADCKKRRQQALDAGESPAPLLSYAEIGDYSKVICRKDNWSKVFRVFFKRSEMVQESINRIIPLRRVAAHYRILTQEDLILLRAEAIRFRRVIKARNK
ncbi:MAG TPA: Swt1 family HEPN domain-containing protein [Thermoanaerobaculia bacterium]|jgi:hypothetical protein|nr:Swt1 family HEPN domain-containing protein [Thermoanaerobaculia bacterium]